MYKCNCKIKDWSNDKFDFTDHTLLCYRGFKTEYNKDYLAIKTGNDIQEFILCKYCGHYRCKDHFGPNKSQKIVVRKCCSDCLEKEKKRRDEKKMIYSILEQKYVNGCGNELNDDDLSAYLEGK